MQSNFASNQRRVRNTKSILQNSHLAFLSRSPSMRQPHNPRTKIKLLLVSEDTHHTVTSSTNESTEDDDALSIKFSKLRSLGIDYGLVRTGIAVTTGGYRPRPLAILSGYTKQYTLRNVTKIKEITGYENGTVHGINNTQLTAAIVSYAQSERVSNIVLGFPLHKNGSISEQSNITQDFGYELLKHVRKECGTSVNVTMWDERYTSKEAASRIVGEAMARNRDLGALDLEGCLDAEAACIILEHYYQVLGKDAHVLTLDEDVEEECRQVYELKLEEEERQHRQVLEDRDKMWNARKEMIERDRISQDESDGSHAVGKKKKKRKKKK
eukprot:scaffold37787_cov56-Cyclotella_meneghiniana.AAC.2